MKKPIRARRAEDKELRRKSILDAAEKTIANRGLEKTNFGEIAKRSRLSRALIYVYFPKREDLIHAVCERGLKKMLGCFEAVVASHATGLDQTLALGHAYHAFSKEEKLYFGVLSEADTYEIHPTSMNEIECAVSQCSKEVLSVVAAAIQRGKEDGSIRKDVGDPMQTAVTIWSFTHGLIQISGSKQYLLKEDLGIGVEQITAQGFRLLRNALASK
ncbi:MAG: TetR/AcrR family transcriptional regulator [Opitutaceae bacterium]|jgi:AcrR family transcriptional regulator